MNKFDEREKSFEKKFVKDEELQFKIKSKRNKYLAEWVCEKLGKNEEEKQTYFLEIIKAFMFGKSDIVYGRSRVRPSKEKQDQAGDDAVFKKIKKDLENSGAKIEDSEIRNHIEIALERAEKDFK